MNEPHPPAQTPDADAGIRSGEPPQSAPPAPVEAIVYRPVSGWAIAGFAAGAGFAALVAVSTVVALAQGAPMFLPMWALTLAVVGMVFSLIGQSQIQDSEGTRAGAKLARLGVWLSVVSGLGYMSYYYVTGLALQNQANAFVMDKIDDGGFFPRLIEGATNPTQINAAFLLTLPPVGRSGHAENEQEMIQLHDQPSKDGAPGLLTQFKETAIPRMLYKDLAKDAVITPLGVQDWKYEMRSYKIYRNYRIKTKELEVEAQIAVASTEAETAGKDRKWFVNMRESGSLVKTLKLTPTGEGIKLLRHLAQLRLRIDVEELNKGIAYPEIKKVDHTNWDLVHVRDGNRGNLRSLLHETFSSNAKNRIKQFNVMTGPEEVGKWEAIDGKIRISHNIRFALDKEPGGQPFCNVIGYAILDTKLPIDPAKFEATTLPLPDWDIVGLVFTQVSPAMMGKGR